MRYKITIIPFMTEAHITVSRYGEELGTPARSASTYRMLPDEGETDRLYDVLAWLAAEIASEAG